MALNKFMHPRNIYKNPPDFGKLSKLYGDFSNISKVDVTGKVSINFKDPHSLRVLTKCLLKADFNLDVDIPEDRLVPTLPLRLNYILWIEDVVAAIHQSTNIKGIDIGTGACAIYPLLAASKNKWHMVATETDGESVLKACDNIQRNNLQDFIEIHRNETTSVIEHLFSKIDENVYDFCMCNPPFYSTVQELWESRSPARLPPKNGFTGSPQELITEGGELGFCRKLINESKRHQNKVLIFTTMVGHKYNLKELLQDLKAEGINHTHTEFCQGRVTRWGLAWTYQEYDLYKLLPPREKIRKNIPIVYLLPELQGCSYNVETAYDKLKCLLDVLQIQHKLINKKRENIHLDVVAKSNTWSNQRRKRRLMKKLEEDAKRPKLENSKDKCDTLVVMRQLEETNQPKHENSKDSSPSDLYIDLSNLSQNVLNASVNIQKETKPLEINNVSLKVLDTKPDSSSVNLKKTDISATASLSIRSSIKYESGIGVPEDCIFDTDQEIIMVHAFFKLIKNGNDILLKMEFLDGSGGKEALHQIGQYIKNNWK